MSTRQFPSVLPWLPFGHHLNDSYRNCNANPFAFFEDVEVDLVWLSLCFLLFPSPPSHHSPVPLFQRCSPSLSRVSIISFLTLWTNAACWNWTPRTLYDDVCISRVFLEVRGAQKAVRQTRHRLLKHGKEHFCRSSATEERSPRRPTKS